MKNEQVMIIKDRLNKLMDQLAGTGLWPEQSKLRLSLPIKDGKGQYTFNLKDAGDGVSTFGLDRNDVLVMNQIGVLLELENADTGVKHTFSFAPIASTEDAPTVFPVGFENDQINKMYTGYMQWLLDNQVMLSAYPMENFKKVPETQGAFVLNSADEPVQEGIQVEHDIHDMLELVYPKYVVAGTRDHKITVNFDAANCTFPCTEGYVANLVLYIDGFLVKGGSEYKGGGASNPFGDAVGQW